MRGRTDACRLRNDVACRIAAANDENALATDKIFDMAIRMASPSI